MFVADVDLPTVVGQYDGTSHDEVSSASRSASDETAGDTNDQPTRVMLWGGSVVSLRDGASRWGRGRGHLSLAHRKAELALIREAQEHCALRKYQLLEEIHGFLLGNGFGLGSVKLINSRRSFQANEGFFVAGDGADCAFFEDRQRFHRAPVIAGQ